MSKTNNDNSRTYLRDESVVFLKTKEAFGGLSNMCAGFPIRVNGVDILTSEALYQACRFPHSAEVQALIIKQRSPMTAKMEGRRFTQPDDDRSRQDWHGIKVNVMRWSLRVKLAQNWPTFSELLLSTENKPIVEQSHKDSFWGAKPTSGGELVGMNVLGRLLMELREVVKNDINNEISVVEPLAIPDFLLFNEKISAVPVMGIAPTSKTSNAVERFIGSQQQNQSTFEF